MKHTFAYELREIMRKGNKSVEQLARETGIPPDRIETRLRVLDLLECQALHAPSTFGKLTERQNTPSQLTPELSDRAA